MTQAEFSRLLLLLAEEAHGHSTICAAFPAVSNASSTPQPASFATVLEDLVQSGMDQERQQRLRLASDPRVPDEQVICLEWKDQGAQYSSKCCLSSDGLQRAAIEERFESRIRNKRRQFEEWARTTVDHPGFELVEPFLKQVSP